jgi:hypothetical protein
VWYRDVGSFTAVFAAVEAGSADARAVRPRQRVDEGGCRGQKVTSKVFTDPTLSFPRQPEKREPFIPRMENVGSQFLSLRQHCRPRLSLNRCDCERIHFCRVFRLNLWAAGPTTIAVGILFWAFFSRPLDC